MKRKFAFFDNAYFSPLFIKDARMIQQRNLDDSYEEKKEENDWISIQKKPVLGAPYTVNPGDQDLDLVKRTNEADPNQITEEFPEREDSKPNINDL